MAERGLVVAFDIGTSSLRTALFDARAKRLDDTTAQQNYQLRSDADGCAELNPATVEGAARACLSQTLAAREAVPSLRRRQLLAVGGSCFWHSLLGVDHGGRAVTPIYTWADSRCAADAERLRRDLDQADVHRRTGCMLHTSFWPAKLRWLRRTRLARWKRVAYWLSPAEWLWWRLGGVRRCALGMATGTGLFDPSACDWDDALLAHCRIGREQLLPLGDEAEAAPSGPLAGIPWSPAIGDGAASNLGSGATRPGLAALNFGTSGAIRIMRSGQRASAPLGLFAYRVDRERYLLGGAVSNAGNLRGWCLRELALADDPAHIERALRKRPTPEHGLAVLPFWTAERSPSWRDDLSGSIHGLRPATTALDILQACTEATFQRLARVADLVPGSREGLTVIASGGLNRSRSGLQRLADVLGRDIVACSEPEASLRGAAVSVLERLGHEVPAPRSGRRVVPDPDRARIYARQGRELVELEDRLHPRPSARK